MLLWSFLGALLEALAALPIPVRLWLGQTKRIKALERENRELRQTNEILRKASAFFALAQLDRRFKP
jgi:transposase-like protein